MKKLNKLQINSEKLMKSEELITLRGGYGSCGGSQEWRCNVSVGGSYAFSGRACGSQGYISSTCSSLGYSCDCTLMWNYMPIFIS
jgi:hypothetical protein